MAERSKKAILFCAQVALLPTYHRTSPLERRICWLSSGLDTACAKRNLAADASGHTPEARSPEVDDDDCGIAGRLVQCSTIVTDVWLASAVRRCSYSYGRSSSLLWQLPQQSR